MVLHMISTAAMIRIGRVYRNYMVGVRPTNRKLVARACSIISSITGANRTSAARALRAAGLDVRLAITMLRTGRTRTAASQLLARHGGNLRDLLSSL
jgi:N-acetylmuramic acid 6-phosphate etherase